jgi:hypothetical protein
VALLVTFNQAIDGVLKNNQKARQNPKALAQLDGYKRGLVNSLTGNLQRFGFERAAKVETLQEIIDEMGEVLAEATIPRPLQTGYNSGWKEPLATQIMAKAKTRTRKPKRQITDWNIGQPLAFPQKKNRAPINRLAREAVAEAMRGPFKLKRPQRKKK